MMLSSMGAIDFASEAIRDFSSWIEDLAWEVYLRAIEILM